MQGRSSCVAGQGNRVRAALQGPMGCSALGLSMHDTLQTLTMLARDLRRRKRTLTPRPCSQSGGLPVLF